jgi:catechol 2,3-dioxygenase-like lactoylglutathione lyase family enzyme
MEAEVIGIDHIYVSVREMAASERFYDEVLLGTLGFRKNAFAIGGEPHIQYYNRHFGFVIRPARAGTAGHDPYAPGLHHFCLRVESEPEVDRVASALRAKGVEASEPRYYPEYAPDYYATFFDDPDGVRLEVTNFRANRKARMFHWDEIEQ